MKTKKLILKALSILTLMLFVFTGCKNDTEEVIIVDNPGAITGMKVINYGYYGKDGKSTSGTSIAVFDSQSAYDNTIASLESQVEAWDDQFITEWGHLDEESLNLKEEELNFDDEKPLTDFENQAGLSSLRKKYLAEEEAWLNNEELNSLMDPDNKSEYDFEENEQAVLNRYSEVQIGTKIIKELSEEQIQQINQEIQKSSKFKNAILVENGATLVIEEEDYNSLIEFNEGDMSVIDNDNVSINESNTSGSGCESGKARRVFISISSDRRIKAIIKARKGVGGAGKIKAKMKSYKKKGRRWKKRRANISAGLNGNIRNNDCITIESINDRKRIKKRKKSKFQWKDGNSLTHPKVSKGNMKGTYYINGINKELILDW